MKYAIQINHAPRPAISADSAYCFIQAAIQRGHDIIRVFFYHDGIHYASQWLPQAIAEPWSTLAAQHGIDLVICISAAQRRGLLDPRLDIDENGTDRGVALGFRIAGLGLWVDACLRADRVMVFA